jgi:hypothetical protein
MLRKKWCLRDKFCHIAEPFQLSMIARMTQLFDGTIKHAHSILNLGERFYYWILDSGY